MSCLIFQLYISVTGQNVQPVKTSQSVSVEMSHCYWSKRPRESKRPTNQNVPRTFQWGFIPVSYLLGQLLEVGLGPSGLIQK